MFIIESSLCTTLCHFLLAYCMKPARFQRGKDLSQLFANLSFYTNSGTNVFMDFMFYISIQLQMIYRPVLEDCASVSCVGMQQTATLGENSPRSRSAPVNTWLLPLEAEGSSRTASESALTRHLVAVLWTLFLCQVSEMFLPT